MSGVLARDVQFATNSEKACASFSGHIVTDFSLNNRTPNPTLTAVMYSKIVNLVFFAVLLLATLALATPYHYHSYPMFRPPPMVYRPAPMVPFGGPIYGGYNDDFYGGGYYWD